jgi:DNA-directed RNA polymerase subunit RPC12/RpoP
MYIKKTNVVEIRSTTNTFRKVQCPYCKVCLESVAEYITAMICWNCDREFRIEQDKTKIVNSVFGGRTILRGVIK